jgi:hypothetical protein
MLFSPKSFPFGISPNIANLVKDLDEFVISSKCVKKLKPHLKAEYSTIELATPPPVFSKFRKPVIKYYMIIRLDRHRKLY